MAENTIRDQELFGEKGETAREEMLHHGRLSAEELEIEKKLRRKIDIRIMPLVILVYLMNYIDRYAYCNCLFAALLTWSCRNNYAAARLQGLERDLHLVGSQYQTGLSILFVGYILMQVPSNLLLNYAGRPSWYLGGFTIAWGLVSCLTSQVKSFGSIVACRFILGIVEAPFFAGVLFYLSKVCDLNCSIAEMLTMCSGIQKKNWPRGMPSFTAGLSSLALLATLLLLAY
jgi:MFS family permease